MAPNVSTPASPITESAHAVDNTTATQPGPSRFTVAPVMDGPSTSKTHECLGDKATDITGPSDSGYIVESCEFSDSDQSDVSFDGDSQSLSFEKCDPRLKEINDRLIRREESLRLDRQRNLLSTQLQHLKKNANILVIGPDNAGKTSLINSLDYMVRKKDGNQTWRSAASYDLGKKYKFKQVQVWPQSRSQKSARVTFYEAGGFSKIKEADKAATILQYAMEGRLEGRISSLLQMFLLMNIQDITERYREDPADIRLLHERKIDAIIHVTPASEKPDHKLFELIKNAVNKSKDPCIKKIPILTCVTSPHDEVIMPVCPLDEYDLGSFVKKSQETTGLRRNRSSSKLLGSSNASSDIKSSSAALEPASVRHVTYYRPAFDPLSDETDDSNISPNKNIDQSLLTLFEEALRLAAREPARPMYKALYKNLVNVLGKRN